MKIHSAKLSEVHSSSLAMPKSVASASLRDLPRIRKVAVLSGGRDKPYSFGLTASLTALGIEVDFIGSDEFDVPQLVDDPRVNFLNLRGDQYPAPLLQKMMRVLVYYWRLIRYAAISEARIFHILWNNKFEFFDRTFLMLYYKALGKKIVFTAHNVNKRERDGKDSWLNRFSLRIQYRLADHIFVHTDRMRRQLIDEFGVAGTKATRIPFGLNSTIPNTSLTSEDARAQIGLASSDKAILFFGQIAPYKGLEFLVRAFAQLLQESSDYRLIIVGFPKEGAEVYWQSIQPSLAEKTISDRTIQRIEYIPDEDTEIYFKAADVLVLPYTHIFQSGVLFLGYNFGLPAIAADVGALRDEIVEGETGSVFEAKNADDLVERLRSYFGSDAYRNLPASRQRIRAHANEHYSWDRVAETTAAIYVQLLGGEAKA